MTADGEIVTVQYQDSKKRTNAMCGEKLEMFNGKAGGRSTCSKHCLEGQVEVV